MRQKETPKHELKRLRLSASRCGIYLRCPKMYWWTYYEQLQLKAKPVPLRVGALVHRLLHQDNIGTINLEALSRYDEVVQKLFPDLSAPEALAIAQEAVRLYSGYATEYHDDPLTTVSSEMHLEQDRGDYILYSRVDGLARTQDERLWRVEHKTTARLDSAYLSGLKGSIQTGIAYILLKDTVPEKVQGTIYNLLVKTKIPSYYRNTVLQEKDLERMTEEMLKGVVDGILSERFHPSMQCFTYNRECDFLPLCKRDSKKTREAFYEHRPDQIPTNEGEEDTV